MNDTDIEYLDKTWNPVVGCTNGCPWCWARRQAKRQKHNCRKCYAFKPHLHPERLDEPLRRRKPSVIGVAFMGELFHPMICAFGEKRSGFVPENVLEVMDEADWHTFVLLTKQPQLAKRFAFPPNVVLGVSVEDQESAERLIPELLECPASTRIVSIEPMRGAVDFQKIEALVPGESVIFLPDGKTRREPCSPLFMPMIDGVILGGQTGPGAVAMNPDWARAVRDQCQEARVPFFFKQWGEWVQVDSGRVGDIILDGYGRSAALCKRQRDIQPGGFHEVFMRRVGRKRAGRMLDGRTHDELAWETSMRNAECGVRSEDAK